MGNLTAMKLRNLKEPGRYSDGDGLILVSTKSGKGSWIVRVQANGRRRDIGIGSYPDVSLADAREAAAAVRKQAKAGIDVVAERRKEADPVPTFRQAAVRVHDEHKKSWKNGKHQAQWLTTLESYAYPHFGDKLVCEVDASHIRDALIEIWLDKPETARRVRQRIGAVLDWSFVKGYRSSEAPMRSISKGLPRQPKKSGHFAAMPFSDLPDFMTKIRMRASLGRLALEFLILNASRSGEVRGAQWSEFDLKRKVWTIKAAANGAVSPYSRIPLAAEKESADRDQPKCNSNGKINTPGAERTPADINMATKVTERTRNAGWKRGLCTVMGGPSEQQSFALPIS